MGRYYQEHKYKAARREKAWRRGNTFRRSSGGKKGKLLMLCGVLAVAAIILWQTDTMPFAGIKSGVSNLGASLQRSFSEAVAWSNEKLGLKESEFALPVSSGVVVEEYGVVLNEAGEESYHSGVDIQVPAGSEILAAENGEVIAVDTHDDSTFWITLSHEGDWSTVYGRLGEAKVAVGDTVEKGAVLGVPKNETLHFEVLENGTQKNPINYFSDEQ